VYVPLITELEAPTASVAIGFPVIVNPIIGSVTTTLVRVVSVLVTAKNIRNHITHFTCSAYCCFHKRNTWVLS
jgi:hypothetical protein